MIVAVGMGCSLGDRYARLALAVRQLDATPWVRVLRVSRLVRTPPLRGGSARGWFLNAVALVDCARDPGELLLRCQALESLAGRRRARHWGDRTLDLDVLLADSVVRDTASLTLPHPAIRVRPFVLAPLLEVWPDAVDPRTGTPYRDAPQPTGPRAVRCGVLPRRAIACLRGTDAVLGAPNPPEARPDAVLSRHRELGRDPRDSRLGRTGGGDDQPVAHRA